MEFKEINQKFTEVIGAYINLGYRFNLSTMSGTEGEIAKADMTDGERIVRVVLSRFSCFEEDWNLEGVEIIVGEVTDKAIPDSSDNFRNTVWNDHLKVIASKRFYQIGNENRNGEKFFGTKEEAIKAAEKKYDRWASNHERTCKHALPEESKKVALSFIKRQPHCKSCKLSDIQSVYSIHDDEHNAYYVVAKFRTFQLR